MLEIRYTMVVLVADVTDHMLLAELALGPDEGIRRYCARLARIYESEEAIGGLPINMAGFRLFDACHPSSRPLCLAFEAARLADAGRAVAFLRSLTHATVCDCRPTTHGDVILDVAGSVGLDGEALSRHLVDGSAEAALAEDLRHARRLGIRSLPSYRIRNGDRALVFQSFDYRDFEAAMAEVMA